MRVITTTNYNWVSNWPRFVRKVLWGNSPAGISDHELNLYPGKKFFIFFQIQPIETHLMIWKRSHQIFQAIKALELLPAWSWFEDWWLVVSPITIRQSVGWTTSAHSVFTAPLSFSDGANATTKKLQNTKAGFSGAECQWEDNLSNVPIRPIA